MPRSSFKVSGQRRKCVQDSAAYLHESDSCSNHVQCLQRYRFRLYDSEMIDERHQVFSVHIELRQRRTVCSKEREWRRHHAVDCKSRNDDWLLSDTSYCYHLDRRNLSFISLSAHTSSLVVIGMLCMRGLFRIHWVLCWMNLSSSCCSWIWIWLSPWDSLYGGGGGCDSWR